MNKELINKAIAHITDQANKGNVQCIIPLSEQLINKCDSDHIAEMLLAENKKLVDIAKSIESRAKDNGNYISDAEAHEMLFEYYGISERIKPHKKILDITEMI